MLLKNSIQKTKNFLYKSLQSLRSFLFGRYQKLPKTLILNPLSCSNAISNSQNFDQICSSDLVNQWEPECQDFPTGNLMKKAMADDSANLSHGSSWRVSSEEVNVKIKQEIQKKAELPIVGEQSSRYANGGSFHLAQKMKVLEMMNVGDVDHALDVEEALHYYSRLTCPVYVDIVDKFFMDMYKDFYVPQLSRSLRSTSLRINSSRRLGPIML